MPTVAKTRIEIYSGAKVFFDQFKTAGWLASPLGGISFPSDDAVTLTIQAGQVVQNYGKAVFFPADTYTHAVLRITDCSANGWMLYLQEEIGGVWVQVATGSTAGIFDVNFSALFTGNCTGVELVSGGTVGQNVTFDLLCICKGLIVPDEKDVITELQVNLPVLRDAVSGFSFQLLNVSETYSSLEEHDAVILYLGRSGETGLKVFGGRIISLIDEVVSFRQKTLRVEAHGHAGQLQHAPSRLSKGYEVVNGRTIIEDCIALAPAVARHPSDSYWFDCSGSVGSTDDQIDSVHSVEFDAENPYRAAMQIIDEATNPASIVGFELIELPSGCLVGHLRGSADFVCPVSPVIRKYSDKKDALLVANRITVYGAKQRSEPSDPTEWTDGDSANWTATYGTLSDDAAVPNIPFGSTCLKCMSEATGGGSPYKAKFKKTYSNVYGKGIAAYGNLSFSAYSRYSLYSAAPPKIRLYAPDVSNCFECEIPATTWNPLVWVAHVLALGEKNEYSAENPSGQWTKVGSPSWLNLSAVEFEFQWITFPYSYIALSAVCFTEGAFRKTANDTVSQAKTWGIIEAEPVSDGTLISDDSCLQKANSLLETQSDSERCLDPVVVDGDARYMPGELIALNSAQWVIREVIHVVNGNMWDTELQI